MDEVVAIEWLLGMRCGCRSLLIARLWIKIVEAGFAIVPVLFQRIPFADSGGRNFGSVGTAYGEVDDDEERA